VEEQVLRALTADGGVLAQAVTASQTIEAAAGAVAEAEHELELFVNNPRLLTLLGEARFMEGAETRQAALDEARNALARHRQQHSLAAELADGDLLAAWPTLAISERRRLMYGLLDQVIVTRATSRGRHAGPIADRVEIILRGGTPLDGGKPSVANEPLALPLAA
jgi:hypothetical protein